MHRAFQLEEIVSLIAIQVAVTKCADVVKLARGCRTLAWPCLDILWSNYQDEFLPLIMCLPRDCFVLDDDGFESLYVSDPRLFEGFDSVHLSPTCLVLQTRPGSARMGSC